MRRQRPTLPRRRRPVDAVTLRHELESAMRRNFLISLVAALAFTAASARADATGDEAVAKFYRGKTVELLIGAQAGGGTDIAGRLVAQYLGKYIPGHPRVVPENVQGAGSLVLTNQLAHGLAPDGASLGILVSGVAQQPILGEPSAHFDTLKLTWIGTLSSGQKDAYLLVVRKSRGVSTVAQLRTVEPPILLGSSGGNSSNMVFANLGTALFGFHTKLIRGFDGTTSVTLALHRGELDGLYSSYATLSKDSMVKSGALIPVVQAGRQARDPRFPDVPLLSELVSKPDDVALLSFAESIFLMNLPFAAPPDIPADRAAALQRAFLQAAADPGLVAEAQRLNIELSPQSGDYVKSVVATMERTSPAVIARYKTLTAP
jgi:tripartite-type tricarboxylate transporter receptor subunit TctC